MSLQTCKTIFWTQIKIFFYAFRDLSDPPIDSKDPYTIKTCPLHASLEWRHTTP